MGEMDNYGNTNGWTEQRVDMFNPNGSFGFKWANFENCLMVGQFIKIDSLYLMQACKGLEKMCRSPDPSRRHTSDQTIA